MTATVPVEQLRAMIRLLWPEEITPHAKRQLEMLCELPWCDDHDRPLRRCDQLGSTHVMPMSNRDRFLGYVQALAQAHQQEPNGPGCTCGFCAWSAEHVLVTAVAEALDRPEPKRAPEPCLDAHPSMSSVWCDREPGHDGDHSCAFRRGHFTWSPAGAVQVTTAQDEA